MTNDFQDFPIVDEVMYGADIVLYFQIFKP